MKVQELVEKLYEYNPDADVYATINGEPFQFQIYYGTSEGVTKQSCEDVVFSLDKFDTPESEG